jgi:hypothetical protein
VFDNIEFESYVYVFIYFFVINSFVSKANNKLYAMIQNIQVFYIIRKYIFLIYYIYTENAYE